MGDELDVVDRWFTATLSARTGLTDLLTEGADGIHNTEISPKGQYPAVVFQFQGGADVRGNGPKRIGTRGLWLVKGIAKSRDFGDAAAVATQIDAAIDAGTGAITEGFVFACVREAPFSMAERTPEGHDYRHRGGLYRVFAQRP